MSANERQEGGSHYRAEYQHWDFVIDAELDYFRGQITKYVSRWRKKNGLLDLKKAHHFLEKYRESVLPKVIFFEPRLPYAALEKHLSRYLAANSISGAEAVVVRLLTMAHSDRTCAQVWLYIEGLIREAEKEASGVAAGKGMD